MSMPHTFRTEPYDSGLLVGTPEELTPRLLGSEGSDQEVGDLLMALLGWDETVIALAGSPHQRAGQVLARVTSWLLEN